MYVKFCTGNVLCTDGYIHYMKCTDILELCTYTDVPSWFRLFDLPCWLACRQVLAAARCHAYSSSSTLVLSASALRPLTIPSRRLSGGLGAGSANAGAAANSSPPAGGAAAAAPEAGAAAAPLASSMPASSLRHCSGVLLVLESALEDLVLGENRWGNRWLPEPP